jgi:hypothetical protein
MDRLPAVAGHPADPEKGASGGVIEHYGPLAGGQWPFARPGRTIRRPGRARRGRAGPVPFTPVRGAPDPCRRPRAIPAMPPKAPPGDTGSAGRAWGFLGVLAVASSLRVMSSSTKAQ